MNNVLILGYSDLVQRKILNALEYSKKVNSVEVASESKKILQTGKIQKTYNSYEDALINSESNIVYISLPNSMHYEYGKKSLELNKNVIIDKPAVLNRNELNKLINIAKKNNLFISQSCVFEYHKAWQKFISYKNSFDDGILSATFLIPQLNKDNIRMSKKLAGGAFNDMGIYASRSGSAFWGRNAEKISISSLTKNGLDIGFTALVSYGKNKEFLCKFGFNHEYKNNINFRSNSFFVSYDRVFSPPEDLNSFFEISKNNKKEKIEIGKDNTFNNYLKKLLDNYKAKDLESINNEFINSMVEFLKFKKELN